LAARAELEYRSISRSIFGGVLGRKLYALITSCSNVVAFLKSPETDPTIGHILIAIRVEPEYRSVARSFSRWGPRGETDASLAAESETVKLLRLLKLI
jgi:hypothetical protein